MISRGKNDNGLIHQIESSLLHIRSIFDEYRDSLGKGDDKSLERQRELECKICKTICKLWGHVYVPGRKRCLNCNRLEHSEIHADKHSTPCVSVHPSETKSANINMSTKKPDTQTAGENR